MSEENNTGQAPAVEPKVDPSGKFDETYVKSLRDEAAKYRTERNEFKSKVDELSEQVSKFSGLESLIKKSLGESEDPAKVIDSLKSENHKLKLQHNFSRISKQLEADEELTYAALHAKGKLDGIDPTNEKELTKLIGEALEANAKLRAEPPRKAGDNGSEGNNAKGFDFNAWLHQAAKK